MAEETKKHHHLFNHHKKDDDVEAEEYSETMTVTEVVSTGDEVYETEEKRHKRKEHLGEMGAVALYERHEAKDPEHAHRHKIEEGVAAAAAVGSCGFAFHEYHEKEEDRREAKEAGGGGKKHHHLFGRD